MRNRNYDLHQVLKSKDENAYIDAFSSAKCMKRIFNDSDHREMHNLSVVKVK